MSLATKLAPGRATPLRSEAVLVPLVVGTVGALIGMLAVRRPEQYGVLSALIAVGLIAVVLGLANPIIASLYLMAATFFRLAVPSGVFPVDPFLLAFGGLVLSVGLWIRGHEHRRLRIGLLEAFVGLYIFWNVGSMLAPHAYAPVFPLDGTLISVSRFVVIGTVMPLTALLLGRIAFSRPQAMRVFLFALMTFAAYSALVSVLYFSAPSLVWPRYMVTDNPWPERAVGVFNQPVVNGLVLILGFLAALLVASHRAERPFVRVLARLLAPACLYGVYLTHTRSALLGLVVILVLGGLLARGWRTGFVITGAVTVLAVALNWSTFSSSDRKSGGVGSAGEVFDRLNMIATGGWALAQKPLAGWGIGRFPAVNTYHHQQWSPEIPWERGYGIASHTDLVGIGVELGLIGVFLWLLVFSLVVIRLVWAIRTLSGGGQFDRDFAVFALLGVVCLLVTGLTVDMRFFDFTNIVVLLFAGAAIGRAEEADARSARAREPT